VDNTAGYPTACHRAIPAAIIHPGDHRQRTEHRRARP
jgi:hypothetical protein